MTKKTNTRQANFELLRILAMYLIVIWHIKGHYVDGGPGAFHPLVAKILTGLSNFISFHVDLFILITGYFGIRNNKKAIVKNLLLCSIYLWGFNLISYLHNGTFDIKEVIFPISHNPWWFMTVYFLLVLVAPFLEKMLSALTDKEWLVWVEILLVLNVYFGHFQHLKVVYMMGFDLMNMLTVYSLGALLRKPNLVAKFRLYGSKKSLLIALLVLILLRIVIGKLFFKMQIDILPGEYCAPLTIALAVNVFLLFKNVSLKSSRFITFFSTSAVSVYLITEYPMVRDWLTSHYGHYYQMLCHNAVEGVLYVVFSSIMIFVVCVFIDKVRIFIQKNIEKVVFKKLHV